MQVTAFDLCTNTRLTDLFVTGLTFSEEINSSGSIQFAVSLADPGQKMNTGVILALNGNPFKVVVADGPTVLYVGIIWDTSYDSDTQLLTCSGAGLISYFNQTVITQDYTETQYPDGVSAATLLQDVVQDTQAGALVSGLVLSDAFKRTGPLGGSAPDVGQQWSSQDAFGVPAWSTFDGYAQGGQGSAYSPLPNLDVTAVFQLNIITARPQVNLGTDVQFGIGTPYADDWISVWTNIEIDPNTGLFSASFSQTSYTSEGGYVHGPAFGAVLAAADLGLTLNDTTAQPVTVTLVVSGLNVSCTWVSGSHTITQTGTITGQQRASMSSYGPNLYMASNEDDGALLTQLTVNQTPYHQAGANIGLNTRLNLSTPAPVLHPSYQRSQFVTGGQVFSDVTMGITPGTGGCDFYVENLFTDGVPKHTMVICCPRAGRTDGNVIIDLDRVGKFTWPTDATASGNQVFVVGSGVGGAAQPVATATSNIPIGGLGLPPLMQLVLSFTQVQSQSQLDSIAYGALQMYQHAVLTPVVTIPSDYLSAPLGSYGIGDDVRVRCGPQARFPNGLDMTLRIVAYTVTVPAEGVATVALTLNHPPVF